MLKECRDAFICDMAETYHIFDIEAYPVSLIATLAAGLREDSRTRMKMEGQKLSNVDSFLALIFDKLNWLCWTKTKNAEKKTGMPESLYEIMTGTEGKNTVSGFNTPEEFEQRRKEILGEE